MRNAVVNSTPIISFHCIGRLDLLGKMYDEVYLPHGVFEEVCLDGEITINKERLLSHSWLKVKTISNEEAKKYFKTALHKGEVETMILANELKADVCVIDDQLARNYAKYLGLSITGTVGILIKAKERGLIDKVTPYMDILLKNEIYISKLLYEQIKKAARE